MREKLASLISGGGTTMQEIVKACQSGEITMDVSCVISSNPNANGIEKARNLGIDIVVIDPGKFRGGDGKVDQDSFGSAILRELKLRGTTVVTQNGWLPLTPKSVIEEYSNTIFNQHPGPVPEFGGKGMYGRRVHAARLLFARETKRDFWTEVIAQRVHVNYDEGALVGSNRVDIFPNDTVEDLQQRALPAEHRVQIEFLKKLAHGNIKELPRTHLIHPGEESLLDSVKRTARLLYPNG